jgi:hypothetical protein
MTESQKPPTKDSKTTESEAEIAAKVAEWRKKIGQSMVDTLNYNVAHPDAEHRKGK